MLDMVVHRHGLRDKLIQILGLLADRGPVAEVIEFAKDDLEIPEIGAGDEEASAEE